MIIIPLCDYFHRSPTVDERYTDIKYNSYYVAGLVDSCIYLGNVVAPLHVLKVNIITLDTQYVRLQIPTKAILGSSAIIRIDSPMYSWRTVMSPSSTVGISESGICVSGRWTRRFLMKWRLSQVRHLLCARQHLNLASTK